LEINVESAVLLLLVATVVAILTQRLRFPYSVGLVAAGMALTLLPFIPRVSLTKDLIFTLLLPPLIFEAAFYLEWKAVRRDIWPIVALATLGVIVSAAITAAGMHFLAGWEFPVALVFGILIAATDPVSVIATMREAHIRGRIRLLVEAESLFNDVTAAVGFGVAVALASGRSLSAFQTVEAIVLSAGGGFLCGAVVAGLVLFLLVRSEDHLVETACTTIAAYASFLLADSLQLSGVFATVTAGLILGNVAPSRAMTHRGKEAVQGFWEYAAFVANSIIFLLIGMHETGGDIRRAWRPAAIAVLLILLGRAAAIYPICAAFARSSMRVSFGQQHLLFWGGLRGALALALVLGLPKEISTREPIVAVSFAVVAFSIFVQGLTIRPLFRAIEENRAGPPD
jgi:CPA1 family monovalent cation:H+ antiporter